MQTYLKVFQSFKILVNDKHKEWSAKIKFQRISDRSDAEDNNQPCEILLITKQGVQSENENEI